MTDSIKNQFNNSILINPTFNIDPKDIATKQELEKRSRLLSYEIQDIYKQMNYHIDDNLELEDNFFIAEQSIMGGMEKIRILVKCLFKSKNTNVSKDEIQIFDSEFNRNRDKLNIDKGFFVTNTDFEKQPSNIKCITQAELSKGVLYIKDCLTSFIKEYEKEEIFHKYIDLSGKIKNNNCNIVEYILKNIHKKAIYTQSAHSGKNLYTIFGDFGTGKSTILNKLCYEVSKMYLQGKSTKKPLLIELKDFYNSKDILSFVYNAFRKQYRGIEVFPEMIMREITEGKFLLLLDGFDEMSAQISIESRFENFNKLSDLLKSKSVCILTCRSSYFITRDEYKDNIPKLFPINGTFQGRIDSLEKKLDDKYIHKGTLDYDGQSQIITNNVEISINPLTNSQIKTYFERCSNEFREKCNSSIEEIYKFILDIYDLGDLITKPILLSIITDTILLEGRNYLKSDIKYGHSALYEKYTNLILKRDWGKGKNRHYLPMELRNCFSEAIAITMLYEEILEVTYDDILKLIDFNKDILSKFKENISSPQTQEFIASDIRICSFLRRTDENTFKFVHKSFMEFFVAQFIVSQLIHEENSYILSEKILNKEILFFIGGFGIYKPEIQKKIFSVWRKNYKTKNQILKRNLCSAFILSKIEHDNSHKNAFNISDVNIESISIRKITFRNVEYDKVNFINTDFVDVNIEDSKFSNIQIETFKINKVISNNSIFQFVILQRGLIENCSFNLKEIKDVECKELISINTEYNFIANKLNVFDSEFEKCIIKNDLTDSNFRKCSLKNCPEIYLSGENNIFESVIIYTGKLTLHGFFTVKGSKIFDSIIEINETIIFSDCEFKDCNLIGNGTKNLGQFINCKFYDCTFIDFYIEYDYLFYQKKEKKHRKEEFFLDKDNKIERMPLIFSNCTGIILTDTQFIHEITSSLLVFNIENYLIEIGNCIMKKEESIRKWKKEKIERKEKSKEDIEKIKNVILINKGIKYKKCIDAETKKEIDDAIRIYKDKNPRVITQTFDEKKEYEFVMFLKQYCSNRDILNRKKR